MIDASELRPSAAWLLTKELSARRMITWFRVSPMSLSGLRYPPLIVVRVCVEKEAEFQDLFERALQVYSGRTEWTLMRSGISRQYAIYPSKLDQRPERSSAAGREWFRVNDPEFCVAANTDLSKLLDALLSLQPQARHSSDCGKP
ncbi:hypothetical protein [Ahniella affigens]|uniref:hypothetical protein n=1 Tax=Ahniella affigens TaxID=2021234 RepID=UPI0011B1DADC|nr:hypothetical protein [Ahniella affigens]